MTPNEELINKIFNNMNFADVSGPENNPRDGVFNESADLYESIKTVRKPKALDSALESAREALKQWKNVSVVQRSNSLHAVSEALVDKSKSLPGLKNGFPTLVDYFNLYSDAAAQTEKLSAEAGGVVLVVLPPHSGFSIIGATVPAALAAGCSVIVHTEDAVIPLFLEEIILNAGLPEGVFNVVTEPLMCYDKTLPEIEQIVFCGSLSAAQDFYFMGTFGSFKFFCPNNSAAFVLDSCDLDAAIAKIFHETWEFPSFWAVSTVVVQESIIQKFLSSLEFQMERFLNSNNNRLIFKNKEILEKINNVILKAVKAGATVVKPCYKKNEWGPTALVNYQNQEDDIPVLKILVCRTPKEGVKLLNNFHGLGTSIWSEFSAQALEIASQLESPNIWINSHGVIEVEVPLSLTGLNGNFILGGKNGILEYLSPNLSYSSNCNFKCEKVSKKSEVLERVISAQKACNSWHQNKNKRKHFKALADCLENEKCSSDAKIVNYLGHLTNCAHFSEKNCTEKFFVVYEEIPVGVVSLFISCGVDIKELTFLIALPIALGNAVIVVAEKEDFLFTELINFFNSCLPKNLLTIVYGSEAGLSLASDPTVQALWICTEAISLLTQEIREALSKNLKHVWIIPKSVSQSEQLALIHCVRRKIIWLPKVEKFP